MAGGDDGWLTTKKVGRDDAEIKQARAAAIERQSAKNRRKPPPSKNSKNKATKQRKRQKRIDDFVVDDDDDEFIDDDESIEWSEKDDEELSSEEEEDVILSEEESSDEEGPSFMEDLARKKAAKKTVKPMLPQVVQHQAGHRKQHSISGNKKKAAAKRRVTPFSSSSSSDDDDDDDDILEKPIPKKKKTSEPPQNSKHKQDAGATKSRYFMQRGKGTATSPMELDDDDDGDDTPVRPTNKAKQKRQVLDDDDDEDHNDPFQFAAAASPDGTAWTSPQQVQSNKNKKNVFDSDDDDDNFNAGNKGLKRLKKKKKPKKPKSNKKKKTLEEIIESDEEEAPIELLDDDDDESSSSDDNDGGDDNDAFVDEDEQEASNVLAAANELSAQVLRIMTSWAAEFGQDKASAKNEDGSQGMTIPQGMIVDGAIAMSSMSNASGKPLESTHQGWITKEAMKEVLPGLDLADYQLVGVNWLAMLHSMTCKFTSNNGKKARTTNVNGILADEMGLGKTCQSIAFLAWLKDSRSKGAVKEIDDANVAKKGEELSDHDDDSEHEDDDIIIIDGDSKPPAKNMHAQVSMRSRADDDMSQDTCHLVVVPASVVSNWEREFQRFAPNLSVVKFHGTMEERQALKEMLRQCKKKQRPMVDVILAPITYFQKENSEDRDFLRKFEYDYLICDEGHLLKNAKGLRYKNLDKFRTRHRLLLTGTPVQNSPQELMALLCFLMPLFKKRSSGFDEDGADDGGASMLEHFVHLEAKGQEISDEMAYRKLKQLFAPFVLRRRKKDVLSQILPPKTYEVEFCELEPVARAHYNSIVEEHLRAKKNKTKSTTDHLFTTLRKAAHHPHLNRTKHTSPSELAHLQEWFHKYGAFRGEGCTKERVAQELEGFSDFDLHLTASELIDENPLKQDQLDRYILTDVDLFASAKLKRLQQILPEMISKGHRILIFSMWTSCLDLLGCLMEHMGVQFMRMDGQTATSDRQEQIDRFNSDESIKVFLLSTTACGMGINLTSADVCIMHDISLNPFSDLQAEDRCHRIGQKKPVRIIKLVAKDTVDSDIYEMQERKVKMNAAIMEQPSEWNKEEKKEKNLIMKNIVQRHEQQSAKKARHSHSDSSESKKENVANGEIIELL